jgi:hypothetical protein
MIVIAYLRSAGFAMAGLLAGYVFEDGIVAATPMPERTKVAWPFRTDQWARGKAFQCRA